ncbi:asparagine synthase C-terminal domain-containing protein, partial [bacterium]|nr:asparagine synthase C-terminal domain-containing protein [bacterium]MBU1024393.1 asparagine synthase C-terminal domain-containing protein [bacterium]
SLAEIEKHLPSILWQLEEPAWTSLESWFVSKLARQGIKVALAGVGGDELFAGYFPYSHIFRMESFKQFMGPFAKPTGMLAGFIDKLLPDNLKRNPPGSSLHRYATIENLDYASAYFFLRSTFTDDEKKVLFTPDFMKEIKGLSSLGYVQDLMRKTPTDGYIDKFASFDIQNYLAADLLRHLDSMSMAHSLETRVPLLDHRLVEFILGLPDDMKLRNGESKFIFKKAIDDYIPDEIKARKKVGFVFPMKKWMRTEFSPEITRVLKSERFYQRGIFSPGCVNRLLQSYIAGDESQWLRLWSILSVELWARMYIDSDGTNPKEVGFRDFVE